MRGYLARFQHADTPQCGYCEDEVETAEHALCKCHRFSDEREELTRMTGPQMRPREQIKTMMADADSWKAGHATIIKIMRRVRADEMSNRGGRQ
ncbi:hypothetical protein KR018_000567 [Drosophila ironensis]|nr:hypothetical protein KR018_000567 [Drosophila ironensis]